MTRDVYVVPQTVPKGKKEGKAGITLTKSTERRRYSIRNIHTQNGLFFPLEKKMQQYLSPSRDILWMWRKHLEDISSCLLEGLADSTMELIDSRCVGARRNSEGLFLFIPFFETYAGIKQISAAPTWRECRFQISRLLRLTWLWIYYH